MPKSNQNGVGNSDQAVKIAHEYIRHFDEVLGRVRLALRKANGDGNAMKMLAQVDRLEEQYRKAWQLRRAGWSVNRICDQLKNQSIARWFKGSIPRKLLNLDPKFRQKLERPISLPNQPSPELAFILGVFCGRSGIGGHYRGFEIHSRDIVLVERLARAFEKAVSLRGASRSEDYGGVKYHYFGISSNPLARYLVTATNQNTSVPLRELADRECRCAFLQGFFFSCGSAIRSEWHKISVVKSHNKKLLSEVAVILKREGVLALVRGDHRAELVIQDQNDLQRFKELALLSLPEDIRALEQICASRPKRRMFTVREHEIAMKIIEENPSLRFSELSALISERTAGQIDIDQSVLRQWQKGSTPASAKREKRLAPIELALRSSPWGVQLAVYYEHQVEHLHDADRLLPLLKELAWLRGMDESEIPTELPELDRLPELFHRLKLPFSDCHICAWHAAINSSLEAEGLSAIAKGIQNLIRRKWKSVESWLQRLPASAGARSSRTIDGLIENRAILQHDLMELITLLGIEKAAPAMRYLVGLSIASESQVIIQLAETTPTVRAELSTLFRAEDGSNFDADSATGHLYDLLPGIGIALVHRAKADILRRLAAPQTSLGSEPITEGRVLDWLEHIPKYRPRVGMLTELAKKAQQAGLNPMWAVAMMKDVRAKRSE